VSTAVKLFSERQAHWTAAGLTGRAVFDALASDPELPTFFKEADVAAIVGFTPFAIRQRRSRKMPPSFSRFSSRCVRYPRESICTWLADMLHARAT
jgi:hypothetical protein